MSKNVKTPDEYPEIAEKEYGQLAGLKPAWGTMTRKSFLVAIRKCIQDGVRDRLAERGKEKEQ